MFINKAKRRLNNVCGKNIAVLRKKIWSCSDSSPMHFSSRLDIDKNAVQRIECGKRQ